MDRRPLLDRVRSLRRIARGLLPGAIEPRLIELWNRTRGRWRNANADVLVVSYPKAGRTWLRWMLGQAIADHFDIRDARVSELDRLHDADQRVPRIVFTHDGVLPGMRPQEVRRDQHRHRRRSVVLLVRDPRDLVVSDYHHLRSRMRRTDLPIDTFVLQEESGFETVLAFHTAWRDALAVPRRLLIVRYEDLREDPARELRRVLEFVGLGEVGASSMARAVERGSFASMQARERNAQHPTADLRTPDPSRRDAFKVRRGDVGSYRDELAPETAARLDARMREAGLRVFGYD